MQRLFAVVWRFPTSLTLPMQTKFLCWLLLLGLCFALPRDLSAQETVPASTASQPAGQIVAARVRGTITATDKVTNAVTPIVEGSELSQGARVTTGKESSVVLVFSNGATISLGSESLLDIEQFTQDPFSEAFSASEATVEPTTSTTRLRLTRGELVGKVAKLKREQGSTFTVGTPVGAAGIRGTTFRIVYRPDGTGKAFFSMTTLEGNVEVTVASGGVDTPIEVTDNKEVILAEITIEVNDVTGVVTVTTPAGTSVVATNASTTSTQQIVAAAQQIAEAVATVVIKSSPPPPAAAPPPPTTTEEPKADTTAQEAAAAVATVLNNAPGLSTTNSRLTPTDGN